MPAHKVVLASVSPYFHAMFNDDLAEKLQGEVTIQDIDATALQTLVEYSYTGKIICLWDNGTKSSLEKLETPAEVR